MKTFGGTSEQEKAMSILLHDTANDLQDLNYKVKLLGEWLRDHNKELMASNPDTKINSKPYILLAYLESRSRGIQKALDEYTVKFKNDFQS